MAICGKSIYEPPSGSDGKRVLTTSYWPRGVRRDRAGEYVRALAPSRDLLHAYRDGEITWAKFRSRYLALMKDETPSREIDRLATESMRGTITVMCVCADEKRCHRSLLRDLIEKRATRA